MTANPPGDLHKRPGRGPAAPIEIDKTRRAARRRHRILRSTAVLPALFTIFNGLCGFGAIHLASTHFGTSDTISEADLWNLNLAAWLIFAAMGCDMLDGRLARLTRKTSDFGAQLDSLSDMVSFGVAPAVLMLRAVAAAFGKHVARLAFLPAATPIDRIFWCIGAIYVACAALRLARFNVENEPDESSHMNFTGLPSPGAAAAIASLVLLFVNLLGASEGWRSSPWLCAAVSIILPLVTLATALLMVSRFRYPHVVNQYLRNRRPFSFLVKLVVVVLVAVWVGPYVTAAVLATGFALSGLFGAIARKVRPAEAATGTAATGAGAPGTAAQGTAGQGAGTSGAAGDAAAPPKP